MAEASAGCRRGGGSHDRRDSRRQRPVGHEPSGTGHTQTRADGHARARTDGHADVALDTYNPGGDSANPESGRC